MNIDRRKKLYCGPSHKVIPTLTALANLLKDIEASADDINMTNYGGHAKFIKILAMNAQLEVDKIIVNDLTVMEQREVMP